MKQYAVGIFSNDKGDVLLLRRSWSAPWMDYKYSFPGGTVEKDEQPLQALIREIKEEMLIDVLPEECKQLLILTEYDGDEIHQTDYFLINSPNFKEENIILNYENDKYIFLPTQEYKSEEELIPNLDKVFDAINSMKGLLKPITESDLFKAEFDLSFNNLIDNPFTLEKGELHKEKLTLKTTTDRLGHQTKRWVKTEQPELNQVKEPTKPEETEQKVQNNPEHIDYHSIYKNSEKLMDHAKNTHSEDLANFIKKQEGNEKASRLVEVAKKELESRGESLPSQEDKNPYGEKKKEEKAPEEASKKEPEQKEKTQSSAPSDSAQDHLNLIDIADNVDDLKAYLPEIDKDASLSDDEKEALHHEIKNKIGELVGSGNEPKKQEGYKPKEKHPFPDKVKEGIVKRDDGTYNENTGDGWVGDESLGSKAKLKSQKIDKQIDSDVESLLHEGARAGSLVMQTGPGGLGKTFTAVKKLKDSGYKEIDISDKSKRGENSKKGFVHIKGGMTATSLFNTMHDYPNAVFLIDDAKKIFKSPEALEYIKAATDTTKQTLTRSTASGGEDRAEDNKKKLEGEVKNLEADLSDVQESISDLKENRDARDIPKLRSLEKKERDINNKMDVKKREIDAIGEIRKKQFDFKGKVMMISNKFPTDNKALYDEMYEPLISRTAMGKMSELKMDKEAKLYKLSTLIPHFDGGVDSKGNKIEPKNFKERKEVYDFVKELVDDNKLDDISARSLSGIYQLKRQHGADWKQKLREIYSKNDKPEEVEKGMKFDIYSHLENLILEI